MKKIKNIIDKIGIGNFVLGVLFLVVCISSLSYAYFTMSLSGNGNSNVVTTGFMEVEFSQGNLIGNNEKMYPGDHIDVPFTVKNIGNLPTYYTVYLNDVVNTFNTKSDLVYELITDDGQSVGESICPSSTTAIAGNVPIEVGATHHYTLRVTFKETNVSQDDNRDAMFTGKVELEEEKQITPGSVYAYLYADEQDVNVGEDKYKISLGKVDSNFYYCHSESQYMGRRTNKSFECGKRNADKYVDYMSFGIFDSKNECESYSEGNEDACKVSVEKGQTYEIYSLGFFGSKFTSMEKCQNYMNNNSEYYEDGDECRSVAGLYGVKYYTKTVKISDTWNGNTNTVTYRTYDTLTKDECETYFAEDISNYGGQCVLYDGTYQYEEIMHDYHTVEECENDLNSGMYNSEITNTGVCIELSGYYSILSNSDTSLSPRVCEGDEDVKYNFAKICESSGQLVADHNIYTLSYINKVYDSMEECSNDGGDCKYENTDYYDVMATPTYNSKSACESSSEYQALIDINQNPKCISNFDYTRAATDNITLGFSSNQRYLNNYFVTENYDDITQYSDRFNENSLTPWANKNISKVHIENRIAPTNTNYWFNSVPFESIENLSNLKTNYVTSMVGMFGGNSGAGQKLDLRTFNTENVTNMSKMFYNGSNDNNFSSVNLESFTTDSNTILDDFVNENFVCKYKISDKWQGSNREEFESCTQAAPYVEDMNIGDYVELGTNYNQKDDLYKSDWRVLYTAGNNIYLISTTEYPVMSYFNEDMYNNLYMENVENNGVSIPAWKYGTTSSQLSSALQNKSYFESYLPASLSGKAYMIGGAPAEILVKSWNSIYGDYYPISYNYNNGERICLDNSIFNDSSKTDLYLSMNGPSFMMSSSPFSSYNGYEYMFGFDNTSNSELITALSNSKTSSPIATYLASPNPLYCQLWWGDTLITFSTTKTTPVRLRPMIHISSNLVNFVKDSNGIWVIE